MRRFRDPRRGDRRARPRAAPSPWRVGTASADDIVLIAGKGHEPYQEIDGVRHAFDDTRVAQCGAGGARMKPLRSSQSRAWREAACSATTRWSTPVADRHPHAAAGRGAVRRARGRALRRRTTIVAARGRQGAAAALVSRGNRHSPPQVVVADTERALGELAAAMQRSAAARCVAHHRQQRQDQVKSLLLASSRASATPTPTRATATTRSACRWR